TSSIREPVSTNAVAMIVREPPSSMFRAAPKKRFGRWSAFDRKVSDKRIFPAIDIAKSGTRKEDLLVSPNNLKKMYVLRRILNPMGTMDAIEFLIDKLRSTKTNGEFFDSMNT
ncbi:MAG: hypothetical protein AAFO77_14620, partial [Pseudomonadota bacterium]